MYIHGLNWDFGGGRTYNLEVIVVGGCMDGYSSVINIVLDCIF